MLDRGDVTSIEEAVGRLQVLRVRFHIDVAESRAYEHQATLLTGVALARRVFLGGVFVSGSLDVPLIVPVSSGTTLYEAVRELGAQVDASDDDLPWVYVGGSGRPGSSLLAVRTVCAGWRGGLLPASSTAEANKAPAMPLTAVLAAAFAVNEAFGAASGDAPSACRRSIGLSLWSPAVADWLREDDAPELSYLPSKLWLIGLGHLGQAYLWALGLLPYRDPSDVELLLQDFDRTSRSTWSTSILTPAPHDEKTSVVGIRKTRLMAEWAERRGFSTAICERRFDADLRRQDHEPLVALCGVDNALARRALDKVGFDLVVSAGLGSGHADFRTIRIHTLPAQRAAEEIWPDVVSSPTVTNGSAYEAMVASGALDRCGAALLAGVAVGAPFVGAIAATVAIAEILRLLHGGIINRLIDLDLSSLEHRIVLPQQDRTLFNPGFVLSRQEMPSGYLGNRGSNQGV
jgi:hypothetical protein